MLLIGILIHIIRSSLAHICSRSYLNGKCQYICQSSSQNYHQILLTCTKQMKYINLGNYTIEGCLQNAQTLVSKYKMKRNYSKWKSKTFRSYGSTLCFQLSCICAMVLLFKISSAQAKATTEDKIQFVIESLDVWIVNPQPTNIWPENFGKISNNLAPGWFHWSVFCRFLFLFI